MDICFIFNFHVERKLNPYSFFDIGRNNQYFDDKLTEKTFLADFNKKQLPLLEFIIESSKRKDHKFSILFSGTFLELLSAHYPELVKKIKRLLDSDKVELLGGTYNNSLSSLFSTDIFKVEVANHKKLIKSTFGYTPINFANSENIYTNDLAEVIQDLKFKSTIAPMIEWFLGDRNAHQAYMSSDQKLTLLISDYRATERIINSKDSLSLLRNKSMSDGLMISQIDPLKTIHKRDLIATLNSLKTRKSRFVSVNQGIKGHGTKELYHMPETVAMNTSGNDLSHFIGNPLQQELLEKMKSIKSQVHPKKDVQVMNELMALSASENFLSMRTNDNDAEISKPYDSYLQLMNVLADMELRLFKNKI